jgi:hypothetical protein
VDKVILFELWKELVQDTIAPLDWGGVTVSILWLNDNQLDAVLFWSGIL